MGFTGKTGLGQTLNLETEELLNLADKYLLVPKSSGAIGAAATDLGTELKIPERAMAGTEGGGGAMSEVRKRAKMIDSTVHNLVKARAVNEFGRGKLDAEPPEEGQNQNDSPTDEDSPTNNDVFFDKFGLREEEYRGKSDSEKLRLELGVLRRCVLGVADEQDSGSPNSARARSPPCWILVKLDPQLRHFALLKWTPSGAMARSATIIDVKHVNALKAQLDAATTGTVCLERQCRFPEELEAFLFGADHSVLTTIDTLAKKRASADAIENWKFDGGGAPRAAEKERPRSPRTPGRGGEKRDRTPPPGEALAKTMSSPGSVVNPVKDLMDRLCQEHVKASLPSFVDLEDVFEEDIFGVQLMLKGRSKVGGPDHGPGVLG